jgi:thiamine biosynthesis protein ThiS
MQIIVNGNSQEIPVAWRLAELLAQHNLKPERVVVERNGEIVDRASYGEVILEEHDALEILRFVGGG